MLYLKTRPLKRSISMEYGDFRAKGVTVLAAGMNAELFIKDISWLDYE